MELKADPERCKRIDFSTGIYVRAINPDGQWESLDINVLTPESLLVWLRSRGGENPYAENVVGILLGYGHIV